MAEEHKGTIWSQILVAVAVAILVGTTAPWWWAELRDIVTGGESRGPTGLSPPGPDTSAHSSAFDRANAVQSLYNRGKAAPCPLLYQIIDGIAVYNGDSAPLPTDLAQTVFFPIAKAQPTVSDLAKDRIARLRNGRSDCQL